MSQLVLLPLLLALLAGCSATIVMPPTKEGANPAGMVLVQGADVYPKQYAELGSAIQNATDSPLWVGIVEGFAGNFPNPLQVEHLISTALTDLQAAGMPDGIDVFLAAHSLGGIVVQGYAISHASSLRGLLLFGTYLTNHPLAEFPLRVLHLSGTLDGGQARPTRMAETYSELVAMTATQPEALLEKPVVILEAVNHEHFFSPPVPPSVAKTDIKSELDPVEARQMLAARCAAFITLTQNRTEAVESRALLQEDFNTTGAFLAPLYELQRQEAEGEDSEWAAMAQLYLANVMDESVTLMVDSQHEPDLSTLEHQHTSVNVTGDATATIAVFSSVEEPLDPVDASPNAHCSTEIAVKMVSQELVSTRLPGGTFGAVRSCSDLNQLAMQQALLAAPLPSWERFDRRGLPVTYLEDHQAAAGPLWVQGRLRLNYSDTGLTVQSVAIKTGVHSPIFPGNHYCKLLTPSRALEYVLIDGLRGTEP